jgi:hypothetical protein
MIFMDAAEKRFDVRVHGVVASYRDTAASTFRHLSGGLIDRAGHAIRGRSARDASTGYINGGPGNTELERDAASRTAARAGHERNDVVQL